MQTKAEIRTVCRRRRAQMCREAVGLESEAICKQILNAKLFERAERCMLYYPLGQEASLLSLAKVCIQNGKKIAFPRVHGDEMEFIEVENLLDFKEGFFHVMEPVTDKTVSWEEALVLTPGVAFDDKGGRIGYGKGCYDRYFAKYPKLIRAGIALECQLVADVMAEENDIEMQYLFTAQGMKKTAEVG